MNRGSFHARRGLRLPASRFSVENETLASCTTTSSISSQEQNGRMADEPNLAPRGAEIDAVHQHDAGADAPLQARQRDAALTTRAELCARIEELSKRLAAMDSSKDCDSNTAHVETQTHAPAKREESFLSELKEALRPMHQQLHYLVEVEHFARLGALSVPLQLLCLYAGTRE